MDPSLPRWRAMDPAKRREAEEYVRTAKNFLAAGKHERCYELLIKALGEDGGAPGADVLLVAAIALRATSHPRLPSGTPEPYTVFGLIPTERAARDLALVESYYRQASDLLKLCHPSDTCAHAFADGARLVADAWAFLSDPDLKAALDSAYEALEAAEAAKEAALSAKGQSKRPRSDDDGNSKESATGVDKLGRFSKVQDESNADRIRVLELEQKLSSEKLETAKLAHITAQETKEEKKLILEAKKVEKESKMMDAYNNLISKDTSSMSDEERAERVVAMKCIRKALFPETI